MISTREQLHQIVDELPDDQLAAAARYLERLRAAEPRPSLEEVLANAPDDDEPLTDEDLAAIDEGFADIAAGRVISDEELHRQLGIPRHDG